MTDIEIGTREYLTCAQTAKLIRQTLKAKFPGAKFSVRSHVYSGGASIDVNWTDGPTESMVEQFTKAFAGGGFDGMIDMTYNVDSWLLPDGSAAFAGTSGTECSRGTVPEAFKSAPDPGARLVSFGSDYVFTHRDYSERANAVIDARMTRKYGELVAGERGWDAYEIQRIRRQIAQRANFYIPKGGK